MENLTVIKRDGREMSYSPEKIINAINATLREVGISHFDPKNIEKKVSQEIEKMGLTSIGIFEIEEIIIRFLKEESVEVATAYKKFRDNRSKKRLQNTSLMKTIGDIGVSTSRDNANVGNNFSSKLLMIASTANKEYNLAHLPDDIADCYINGDYHIHDLDSWNLAPNCAQIETKKHLEKGFNTGYGMLRRPKRLSSAVALSSILLVSVQNDQFGGVSHSNFDNDLAPYLKLTRAEIEEQCKPEKVEEVYLATARQGMQEVVYNLNTFHSRSGSQIPFSSLNIGLPESEEAALLCQLLLEEYDKGLGKGEQVIFPSLIFRTKIGVNAQPGDPYYYLYELACDVASRRLNPTFFSMDAPYNINWYNRGYIPTKMGCRTEVMDNINGEPGSYGRGNIAPTTMNLPRLGIKCMHIDNEDERIETFFNLLSDMLLKTRASLLARYDDLKKLKVKDLPFNAGQEVLRGSEGLGNDDSIEPILKQGTWGIGFIGLAETLCALIGEHHGQSQKAHKLGLKINKTIREFCDKYKEIDKLNWSCYATPAEGLSDRFLKIDRARYGIIPGVTDKDYYTNSTHIPVGFQISIFDKIEIEGQYHQYCNGGYICYIELDNYPTGETIRKIVDYAFNVSKSGCGYIAINFHARICKECGTRLYHGEFKCPKCNSEKIQGVSRVTGYLALDERFGSGKDAERKDRISHEGKLGKVYRDLYVKRK